MIHQAIALSKYSFRILFKQFLPTVNQLLVFAFEAVSVVVPVVDADVLGTSVFAFVFEAVFLAASVFAFVFEADVLGTSVFVFVFDAAFWAASVFVFIFEADVLGGEVFVGLTGVFSSSRAFSHRAILGANSFWNLELT
jgi:hypothetical protein